MTAYLIRNLLLASTCLVFLLSSLSLCQADPATSSTTGLLEDNTATTTTTPPSTNHNLLVGKTAISSTHQPGHEARFAIDGTYETRWCASGRQRGAWWQVDLGTPETVGAVRIIWEFPGGAYRYQVEGSIDEQNWTTLIDRRENDVPAQITSNPFEPRKVRFLRVTFYGVNHNGWPSFWEVEAYREPLPEFKDEASSTKLALQREFQNIRVPSNFRVTRYGVPPKVNYPVCLTAAATGEVFVGIDEQGSLGKNSGGGRVIRCLDTDADGVADQFRPFATMEHPRGLIYDDGTLWVLHPPTLTAYRDDDQDGVADRKKVLVTGISSDTIHSRGADHTTNGIRMGVDGWIYIAVGDFGFTDARGTDGTRLSLRGGGIVRVRPDGSDMEIYCRGLRNIMDVAIDPFLNIVTRDNTNDGGGWDLRVSHILQSANYGYPSLYINFTEEIMPPLGSYGGGSGCGSMFLNDSRWPAGYGNNWFTCDWGRNQVYIHENQYVGATLVPSQESFMTLQRPTDIDIDGSGRMYVSSWWNGGFSYSVPEVGYVAQVTPVGFSPEPFPNLKTLSISQLTDLLRSGNAVGRISAQRTLLRRANRSDSCFGPTSLDTEHKMQITKEIRSELLSLAKDSTTSEESRVAAVYTLKQLLGPAALDVLVPLATDAVLTESVLRALTDRKSQEDLQEVPNNLLITALKHSNARVRAQAIISLGRLGRPENANAILPLTQRQMAPLSDSQEVAWNQSDPGRVIPHLAVQALISLNAIDSCAAAIGGPYTDGALWAMKSMHSPETIQHLRKAFQNTTDLPLRKQIATTLIRLYHKEGEYKGDWWGTRPDTSGPYYERTPWEASPGIVDFINQALVDPSDEFVEHVKTQITRHHLELDELSVPQEAPSSKTEPEGPLAIPTADPNDPDLIANMGTEKALQRTLAAVGQAAKGEPLFVKQSCIHCHTYANGQTPKGPHLVDIGKRYSRKELIESLLIPSKVIAQGFDTEQILTFDGTLFIGFIVKDSAKKLTLRQADGQSIEIAKEDIEERNKQEQSSMPEGLVNNLTPEQLADLLAYLESLH